LRQLKSARLKACPYCGEQNPEGAQYCVGCGTRLETEEVSPVAETTVPNRQILEQRGSNLLSAGFFKGAEPLDLSSVYMGYSFDEGFSYPDWKEVGASIRKSFSSELWPQAWREITISWLDQLREDLGGNYCLYESWNYLLLSAEPEARSRDLLGIAEDTFETIEEQLGYLTRQRKLYGKRVILAFNEEDDYYSYVSHFHADGNHAHSSGMFLGKGYGHIAVPVSSTYQIKTILAHEFTHNALFTIPIPTWLNEGLAQRMEAIYQPRPMLDTEAAEEHRAYWNEKNIQGFWAGTSFYGPDAGNKLSYRLGELLLKLLSENWADTLEFVKHADRRDGGQDAALKYLGCSLGDAIGQFLGPGQWRPNRKTIAALWEQRNKERANTQTSEPEE
jgi:hypothetical protein